MDVKRTAIVTGGSRGIGKACAIELSRQGFNVVINYNQSIGSAIELANRLPNATAIKADIKSRQEVYEMVEQTVSIYGGVDVLVNNAGISQQKLFTDITEQEWDLMLNTNVKGVFNTCKCVLPYMISQKYGKIINISSMWGEVGASCEVHYSASKAAVIGLTKALSKEVGLSNINVNCICPGVIDTDMNKQLDENTLEELKMQASLNRIGTPLDVAQLVTFLAGDKSSFITGQIITCDGGFV